MGCPYDCNYPTAFPLPLLRSFPDQQGQYSRCFKEPPRHQQARLLLVLLLETSVWGWGSSGHLGVPLPWSSISPVVTVAGPDTPSPVLGLNCRRLPPPQLSEPCRGQGSYAN